jgi:hypothetical protein
MALLLLLFVKLPARKLLRVLLLLAGLGARQVQNKSPCKRKAVHCSRGCGRRRARLFIRRWASLDSRRGWRSGGGAAIKAR